MAHSSDDSMAVADVYAEALLLAAREQGQEEEVAVEMADLVRFMDAHPDFDAFLTSETVGDDARRDSLEKLFRGRMNDLLLNAILVLNDRFRLGLFRQVARCVQLRMEAQHHQQEVTVETPMPLSEQIKAQLQAVVSGRIGKEAILIEKIDPELIGGIVIRYGDQQIDGSVASRLQRLRKRLRERTTVEVHDGRGIAVNSE
jgi:F-type H+-transporting ATPase subunit delta